MIVRQKKMLIFSLLILSMISSLSFASAKEWKEVKFKDEVVIIRDAGNSNKSGQPFARNDETTFILIGDDLGKTGEIAAADIQRYLPLATGCRINVVKESAINSKKSGFMIFLATTKSSKLLNWAGLDYPADLDEQECLIMPVNKFPDGTQGVVLIGGSNRGLLNGVYTLLEKSANVWWEPVRVLNPKYPLYSSINENILSQSNELRWEGTALRWKPVVRERIIYLHYDR
ncbi:MAG: hypothetical protein K8R35_04585, partial [Bacteroidales bacterium]|nr:hypothetical protein [Bacteroidales bacterium]